MSIPDANTSALNIRQARNTIQQGITYASQLGGIDNAIGSTGLPDDPTSLAINLIGRDDLQKLIDIRTAMTAGLDTRDHYKAALQSAAEKVLG